MSLQNKNAIIYGAGGAVGAAVARAFARDGARVFLTGRDKGVLDALAKEIACAGGAAETARIDAMDEAAVASHVDDVVTKAGTIDISFNAIGIPQQGIQGIPLTELSVESFALPIATYPRAHFVTARTAARHMIKQRSGVILMHTPEPSRLGVPRHQVGCSRLIGGRPPSAL
jgi:NAD(P)-dependent dehydrogenase (short-subunit alcohol dehydrogenase family)